MISIVLTNLAIIGFVSVLLIYVHMKLSELLKERRLFLKKSSGNYNNITEQINKIAAQNSQISNLNAQLAAANQEIGYWMDKIIKLLDDYQKNKGV